MYEVKTKVLIACAVIVQVTCSLVFAYSKSRFSEDVAHIVLSPQGTPIYSYLEQPLILALYRYFNGYMTLNSIFLHFYILMLVCNKYLL